jgi:hypothetical protein
MTARVRKAIGSVAILLFVIAYAIVAATIGDHVPPIWWARLIYYVAAGTAWGGPVIPLIGWMNRGR